MIADLVAFVEARLAETEAHARKDLWALDRASGNWRSRFGINLPYSELETSTATYRLQGPNHDPDVFLVGRAVRSLRGRAERALRDVEAKRGVLERARRHFAWAANDDAAGFKVLATSSHIMVAFMASVWCDHPEFRREWSLEELAL